MLLIVQKLQDTDPKRVVDKQENSDLYSKNNNIISEELTYYQDDELRGSVSKIYTYDDKRMYTGIF